MVIAQYWQDYVDTGYRLVRGSNQYSRWPNPHRQGRRNPLAQHFQEKLHSKLPAAGKEADQVISTWAARLTQNLSDCRHPSWLGAHLVDKNLPAKLICGLSCDDIASHPSIKAASESYPQVLNSPLVRPTHYKQLLSYCKKSMAKS
tara:strand:+ start:4005 stop:4442 length:438 start_codon:yes stop_codon:yes gene_type:complete